MKIIQNIFLVSLCIFLSSCFLGVEENQDEECILFSFGENEYFDEIGDHEKAYLDLTNIKLNISNYAIEITFKLLELPDRLSPFGVYVWAADFKLNNGNNIVFALEVPRAMDFSKEKEISDILKMSNKLILRVESDGPITTIGKFSTVEFENNSLVLKIARDEVGEISCIDLNTPVRFLTFERGDPETGEDTYPESGFKK